MKSLYLFLFCLIMTLHAYAQSDPPAPVQTAFQISYPEAKNTLWLFFEGGYWQGYFKFKDHSYKAKYFSDGRWIETIKEIRLTEFPKLCSDSIKIKYKGWETDMLKIVDKPDSITYYDVMLVTGSNVMSLRMKPDGSSIVVDYRKKD